MQIFSYCADKIYKPMYDLYFVSKGNYENRATFKYASAMVTKIVINNNSHSNFDST